MNTNAKFRLALGYVTSYTGLNFDNFIWARLREVILVCGKFVFAHVFRLMHTHSGIGGTMPINKFSPLKIGHGLIISEKAYLARMIFRMIWTNSVILIEWKNYSIV